MDASAITYTAPFAGAVQRTLADKLAETVSVTDFGAVPNDSTKRVQNSLAFEAAALAAFDIPGFAFKTLHVPAGRWCLSEKFQLWSNMALIGPSKYSAVLDFAGVGGPLLDMTGCTNTTVRGIAVDGVTTESNSVALNMTDSYSCNVSEMMLLNADILFKLYGTAEKGAYYCNISDIVASGTNRIGFYIDSAVPQSNVNLHTFRGCHSHHAQIPWAVLSGGNNHYDSPGAESVGPIDKFFIVDKVINNVITNPRCEASGPVSNIGVHVTSNAENVVLIGGDYQNLTTPVDDDGVGTIDIRGAYTPPAPVPSYPPATPVPARYWGVVKTDAAAGGGFHNELKVADASGPVTVTYPMMYEQSGINGIDYSKLIDGDNGTLGFHTDTAPAGAFFKLDFGTPVELTKWEFYVSGGVNATWDIIQSVDGVSWTTAATGLDCSGPAGWKTLTW